MKYPGRKFISVQEAWDKLLSLPQTECTEAVPLAQALGRVAAEDLLAGEMVPPFARSPFDGYALRGEDTAEASREHPVTLRITEELPAGTAPTKELLPGWAAKVLTGAPVPPGTNTVVKYEDTEYTQDTVTFFAPVTPNTNVIGAGEDVMLGEVLVRKGQSICPSALGVLASVGMARVPVFRAPKASLITTGSELISVEDAPQPAKIRNSNVYSVGGYLRELGISCEDCGTVPDDPALISQKIRGALAVSDLVVTTGGASVGDYDWAVTAAQTLGAEILFWKVGIRPGGAMLCAALEGKLILSLSGSPSAAIIGLMHVALPYLRRLCGRGDYLPQPVEALLKKPLKKESRSMRILHGTVEIEGGTAWFAEQSGRGNGDIRTFLENDCFAQIPPNSPPQPAGTRVQVYRFR